MKNSKSLISVITTIALGSLLAGCVVKEQPASLQATEPQIKQPVEIKAPLTEFSSDTEEAYRAVGSAEDFDKSLALERAREDAIAQITTKIEITLKRVAEDYAKSARLNTRTHSQSEYERLSKSFAEQTLTNWQVLDQKIYLTPQGTYDVYVAIELPRSQMKKVAKKAIETLTDSELAGISANKAAFEAKNLNSSLDRTIAAESKAASVNSGKGSRVSASDAF